MEVTSINQTNVERRISMETEIDVIKRARLIGEGLRNPDEYTIALIGGCAMTDQREELLEENQRITDISSNEDKLLTVHRIPVWKPRSNPEKDWEGLETNLVNIRDGKGYAIPGTQEQGSEAARNILADLATQSNSVAIEFAKEEHIGRYGPMLAFGWIGSRSTNAENEARILRLALRDPMMPLGIKNGMDGSIDVARNMIKKANAVREGVTDHAPAVMIFRGGEDLSDPESWKCAYLDALGRTDGKLIVDVAHGSEMAHNPSGEYKKSIEGQIAAMEAVIELAEAGHIPAGIMIEASDLESPTDPVMPLEVALNGVKRLHAIKMQLLASRQV